MRLGIGFRAVVLVVVAPACGGGGKDEGGGGGGGGDDTDHDTAPEPPAAPEVAISPAEPRTADDLVATVTLPEGEDDADTAFQWYRNGSPWEGSVDTVPASQTEKGDAWTVEVYIESGGLESDQASDGVVVLNTAPETSDAAILPTEPTSLDTLTLDLEAVDPDEDPVTWDISWSRDGTAVPDLDDLTVVASDWLSPGEEWTAEFTPSDGEEAGEVGARSVTIGNLLPSLEDVSLDPTDPRKSDTIVALASGMSDPDDQEVLVRFQWYVNGAASLDETTSTGTSALSGAFVKGESVFVVATPYDSMEYGDSIASDSVDVGNTAPTVTGVDIDPTEGDENTTFTCTPSGEYDDDGDIVTYTWDWSVAGIAGVSTSQTLDGASFRKGDAITCTATPTDGTDAGSSATSTALTIDNAAPSITEVDLSPSEPSKAQQISSFVSGASDPDGDSISYGYVWYVNGSALTVTTSYLGTSNFNRGDSVYVEVTPTDRTDTGSAVASDVATVVNALPSISSVSLSPSNAYATDTLTATPNGWSDADGDSAGYTYAWYVDTALLASETSSTLSNDNFVKGDTVYCSVTPDDGYGVGTARSSSNVVIQNSAPTADAVVATGSTATECDEIELDASGSSDADGDTLSYTWTLTSKPGGSFSGSSDIHDATDEAPTFVVDSAGSFTFTLSATDGSSSRTDTVSVTVADLTTNTDPVADAGPDQEAWGYATCNWSGGGWSCGKCSDTVTIDASDSYDDDGDPLHFRWTTSSSYATIDSSSSVSSTVRLSNLPATYGVDTTTSITFKVMVIDCTGTYTEDTVVVDYTCTGA